MATIKKMSIVTTGALLLSLVAVSKVQAGQILYGEPSAIADGTGRAWVKLDDAGNPSETGFTFNDAALSGLPPTPAEYFFQFPSFAGRDKLPYKDIGVVWLKDGHPPMDVYDKAHFDFHFYLLPPEERDKITATGDDLMKVDKQPNPELIPKDYFQLPMTEVMTEGVHYGDSTAPEFNGGPFTKTFIYGFYDGKMNFVEPMAAKAYLETQASFTNAPVKIPEVYPESGYYPTSYGITYDATSKEYTVTLSDLKYRAVPEPTSTLSLLVFGAFVIGSVIKRKQATY